jgi:hypothetical protein
MCCHNIDFVGRNGRGGLEKYGSSTTRQRVLVNQNGKAACGPVFNQLLHTFLSCDLVCANILRSTMNQPWMKLHDQLWYLMADEQPAKGKVRGQ